MRLFYFGLKAQNLKIITTLTAFPNYSGCEKSYDCIFVRCQENCTRV